MRDRTAAVESTSATTADPYGRKLNTSRRARTQSEYANANASRRTTAAPNRSRNRNATIVELRYLSAVACQTIKLIERTRPRIVAVPAAAPARRFRSVSALGFEKCDRTQWSNPR
jgi:hypothetical protein